MDRRDDICVLKAELLVQHERGWLLHAGEEPLFENCEMCQAVRKSMRFYFVFLQRYVENSCYEPLRLYSWGCNCAVVGIVVSVDSCLSLLVFKTTN